MPDVGLEAAAAALEAPDLAQGLRPSPLLALDDFAKLLAKQDIVEVVHYSAYRPPSAKSWVPGKIGSRHGGALVAARLRTYAPELG